VDVTPIAPGHPRRPLLGCDSFGKPAPGLPLSIAEWFEQAPSVEADWDPLRHIYRQQVDSMTSNVGHLLWSGIVDERRAARVVKRLLREDMFTGWGIRCMSANDVAYNPLEYHCGTVWPHDTAIVAEGMRRYGFRDEAGRVCEALLQAAEAFGYQLPEVFAGFARDATNAPSSTRTRSSRRPGPQARRCSRCGRFSASTPPAARSAVPGTCRNRSAGSG